MAGPFFSSARGRSERTRPQTRHVPKHANLAYRLPNGTKVQFLNDQTTYLGNQLESEFGGDRCFGVLANMDFIMVATYEAEGKNPEQLLYKKR